MRNGQNNKRMRNNRNNNSSHSSNNNNNNNRRGQNPMTRVFESNGPDIKIRGTASHVAEKYVQLARDARSSGDPVASENYYQHAEHYFRLIAAAQEQFRQNQPQPRTDNEMSSDDQNGDDESENYSNFGAEPGFVPAQQQQPSFQPREQPSFQPREQREHQPREQREHQPREQREHQPREQREHQAREQREHQPRESRPQYQPQPQPQPVVADAGVDRLPSFITGPQPQPSAAPFDPAAPVAAGGERFPPRRRRRPHAPRVEGAAVPAPAGDDFNPGNS
jgi:hypothetical protein